MSRADELLQNIMVEDVLDREGIDYKHTSGASGEQLNLRECPFCGGTASKVFINRESGLGNCFHGSCPKGTFNAFQLIREILDRPAYGKMIDYLEGLARELGWRPARRKIEVEVVAGAWELPDSYALPLKDGRTLSYLTKRGLDAATTQRFHLRYCIDGWFNFQKPDGSKGGMNFAERVLIPVYDIDGTMVTFQGRDLTGSSDRKYLFPPGLPGTANFLFNGQNVTGKHTLIMNEGAFDVVRTEQNIFETRFENFGVVGSFGITLSKGRSGLDQVNRLIRLKALGLHRVIVMWDGEPKAFEKALDACAEVIKVGLRADVALTSPGKDPGELTPDETVAALASAIEITPVSRLKLQLRNPYRDTGKT